VTAIVSHQFTDAEGRPEGGVTFGTGFTISWQRGPLGRGDDRQDPNGAFVETIIEAVVDRILFYNKSGFRCDENDAAVAHLESALASLRNRTARREKQGVEGTHRGS
jgi:hypothetical protein